jgi:glycosyltransferase involved in cell wall biosynthesis
MPQPPSWPKESGPRILTLVGNDLTIDVRARKTASALARAGFSVIALGVDNVGNAPTSSDHDGGILFRVVPPTDPRISPRIIRMSRNELRDAFRYRADMLRGRLRVTRHYLTSRTQNEKDRQNALFRSLGRAWWTTSTRLNVSDRNRERIAWRIEAEGRRVNRILRVTPKKARAILLQRRYHFTYLGYKWLARPPKRSLRKGKWRRDLPEMHRYELAIGPLVDMLAPDLIHVHDIFHLGVAVRAKSRAHASDRSVKVVYDAHEFVQGLPIDPRRRSAYTDLEREYIGGADAVVTVSPGLIQLLEEEYGIDVELVMNAPDMSTAQSTIPIRQVAKIPEGGKLLVYVGGIAPHRGAERLIDALIGLPEHTYLVFVSATSSDYISGLSRRADGSGLGDRVRFVPYVPPEAVVAYIESADVSVIPLSREIPNYEVALPNKLFQSIQARVPVAVSDNPDMKQYVETTGIGEVFEGSSVADMTQAIRKILDDPEPYQVALARPELQSVATWEHQMTTLTKVYRNLNVQATTTS